MNIKCEKNHITYSYITGCVIPHRVTHPLHSIFSHDQFNYDEKCLTFQFFFVFVRWGERAEILFSPVVFVFSVVHEAWQYWVNWIGLIFGEIGSDTYEGWCERIENAMPHIANNYPPVTNITVFLKHISFMNARYR